MKKLHFTYDMHIEYSVDVSRCNFTIKCIPLSNMRQQIEDISIELNPNTPYLYGNDGLGNRQIYGVNELPHKTFDFHIEGNAVTGKEEFEEYIDEDKAMIFAHPHGLNLPSEEIRSFYKEINMDGASTNLDKAIKIMHCLHSHLHYKPLVTDVNTSAAEAFKLGEGVCQDYAHIFISLLHMAHISARYVTGLIVGEGASHAWVEILDGNKWYGLDPTNNCAVSDEHIKIGIGRDARDCTINRGIMHGGGLHTQTVKVVVTE